MLAQFIPLALPLIIPVEEHIKKLEKQERALLDGKE